MSNDTATPSEIDTGIADAWLAVYKIENRIAAHDKSVFLFLARYKDVHQMSRTKWSLSVSEAWAKLEEKHLGLGYLPFYGDDYPERLIAEREELRLERIAALDVVAELEKSYTGWSRFFAVTGGHLHSSMSCHTCNKGRTPTRFAWVTDLSGLTESEAVDKLGPALCSVCFPSAPVEHQEQAKLGKTALRAAGVEPALDR